MIDPVVGDRQRAIDREVEATQVDTKDFVEAFFRRLCQWLRIDYAGVGNEDIDLAFLATDLIHQPVDVIDVLHVTLDGGHI